MTTANRLPTIPGMKSFYLLSFFLLPVVLCAQENAPTVEGYISSVPAGVQFQVNGHAVVTTPATVYQKHVQLNGRDAMITDPALASELAMGDDVQVFGQKDRHTHAIRATQIVLQRDSKQITGFAVVQRVIATSPQLIVEADGYRIAITAKTALHNRPPLTAQTVVAPNMWIAYRGRLNHDGTVVADRGSYSQFELNQRAKKMLAKWKGKFVAPDYGSQTGGSSAGTPRKDGEVEIPYIVTSSHKGKGRVPAEFALQQRISKIGQRLVPTCQHDLANTDPQKIDFRFYAFDDKGMHHAVGSPDGLVIIPMQVVEKLQNDDQVAAVLAEGMAQVLERQLLTAQPKRASAGAMIAVGALPFVGPLAGLAMESDGLYQLHDAGQVMQLQSERVGLSLLHDAGYDVRQAPVAWQILQYGNTPKRLKKPPSEQSAYLLSIIGLEYSHDRPPIETAQSSGN
ncbi:MAG TPA: DUF5666 domain-containing protein [Acidobacteriaceae bacterium]|nr:DUF5666 domain-containing protein [Acidobacteriaceae bacterium]